MPIGRYIRGLNTYDLFGNLLPGVVALIVTLGVFATPPIPDDIGEYALFALVAYLTGSLIQSVASTAVGRRKHFDWTMSGAEERSESELTETEGEPKRGSVEEEERRFTIGNGNGLVWKLAHPFVGPLFWWLRPGRGKALDDKILVNRIWEYLIDTHEIPIQTTSYSVLYHVMSSRVDNIQSPSRAVRMQALRNLNRGMWIAAWYSSVLLIMVFVVNQNLNPGETIPVIGLTYEQPVVFEYWEATWTLIPIAVISVLFFWLQAESTEEDYIEYLFADYVVAVASEAEDISFDEDTTLTITGQFIDNIGHLSNKEPVSRSEESGSSGKATSSDSKAADQSNEASIETGDTDTTENRGDDVAGSDQDN